ncbi:MAG: hypothetical protein D0433_03580 [Candidatus Thermochlorobacter aerophilum]|uniref:Uncharacterized protein n=1 Tax=Candidatus Thermochlorobacter aerophilus TaxID=1868324 RepID=A0A395M282_9BACT|nr:MAG: hypothetical protein D0433_03580 [Candidatus Thermochlorobacter aerophilum]
MFNFLHNLLNYFFIRLPPCKKTLKKVTMVNSGLFNTISKKEYSTWQAFTRICAFSVALR